MARTSSASKSPSASACPSSADAKQDRRLRLVPARGACRRPAAATRRACRRSPRAPWSGRCGRRRRSSPARRCRRRRRRSWRRGPAPRRDRCRAANGRTLRSSPAFRSGLLRIDGEELPARRGAGDERPVGARHQRGHPGGVEGGDPAGPGSPAGHVDRVDSPLVAGAEVGRLAVGRDRRAPDERGVERHRRRPHPRHDRPVGEDHAGGRFPFLEVLGGGLPEALGGGGAAEPVADQASASAERRSERERGAAAQGDGSMDLAHRGRNCKGAGDIPLSEPKSAVDPHCPICPAPRRARRS